MSNSLQAHKLLYTRPPCPSPTPKVDSNSCPSSWWCYPTISSSVVPFSSCLQSFPASGSFPMSQFFTSGGQSIASSASASVFPMNIQDWFPLGWTGWISLQFKGLQKTVQIFSRTSEERPPITKHFVGKDWGQEEKGTAEDEMIGWYHQLNGHEFGWTPGVGDRQGGLACWNS